MKTDNTRGSGCVCQPDKHVKTDPRVLENLCAEALAALRSQGGNAPSPGLPTRLQIAWAIADGWTNGNETYEQQHDFIRIMLIRLTHTNAETY